MNSERRISKKSAKELKDEAIKKALQEATQSTSLTVETVENKGKKQKTYKLTHKFSFGRFSLAFICTAAAVFSIVYLANANVPDASLKIAAIQTGIEASYPSYVPRNFSLTGVVSEDGKITMTFLNSETKTEFTLSEENSSWDSAALLNNFVKKEYGNDYTTIRESGLTIYLKNSDASWVSGGLKYTLTTTSGSLTKKQITSIAVSV